MSSRSRLITLEPRDRTTRNRESGRFSPLIKDMNANWNEVIGAQHRNEGGKLQSESNGDFQTKKWQRSKATRFFVVACVLTYEEWLVRTKIKRLQKMFRNSLRKYRNESEDKWPMFFDFSAKQFSTLSTDGLNRSWTSQNH